MWASVAAHHFAQLLHPALDLDEGVRIGDIEDEERRVCVPVVDGSQRVEALLPGGVPDGQADTAVADAHSLVQEGGLDGRRLAFGVGVLAETQDERCLAYAPLAEEHHLGLQPLALHSLMRLQEKQLACPSWACSRECVQGAA